MQIISDFPMDRILNLLGQDQVVCKDPKDGVCPEITARTGGDCIEGCTDDHSCTGIRKCCSNGCGRECTLPGKGLIYM